MSALLLVSQFLIQFNALKYIQWLFPYYEPHAVSPLHFIVSAFFLLLPTLFIPLSNSPAASAAWIYYFFIYLSAASIGITIHKSLSTYTENMLFLLAGLVVILGIGGAKIRLKALAINIKHLDLLYFAAAVAVAIFAWQLGGFALRLGISDIYERRLEARETVGFGGYILALLRLLFPLLAVYALIFKRNVSLMVVVVAGCLGVFALDGTKSSILYIGVLFLIAVGIKTNTLPVSLIISILALNAIAILEKLAFNTDLMLDYFVRRALIVPGWLSSIYWSYDAGAQSLRTITYDVGLTVFGNHETNANTNFMMFAWLWGGWLGGVAIAAIAGGLVYLLNYVPCDKFPCLGSLMAAGCMLIWSEQFFHTSLLSSGVIWVVGTALLLRVAPAGWGRFVASR